MSCPVTTYCKNEGSRCEICIGFYPSDEWESLDLQLHYSAPWQSPAHPYEVWKRRRREQARQEKKDRKRAPDYQKKSRTVKRALKTEEKTRRAVVRATRRSGALNGDGDTRIEGTSWGLDDKFHSQARTRVSVNVPDIEKATRQHCLIVVTLATGEKFVVAPLDVFIAAAQEISEVQHFAAAEASEA